MNKVIINVFMVLFCIIGVGCGDMDRSEVRGVVSEVEFSRGSTFGARDYTIIRFQDGRIKSFGGICTKEFKIGRESTIVYRHDSMEDADIIININ